MCYWHELIRAMEMDKWPLNIKNNLNHGWDVPALIKKKKRSGSFKDFIENILWQCFQLF